MGDFDPNDENCWYFGMVPREESTSILQTEKDSGVFLVRDSGSIHGDFVLCVKEESKISNYIINKIQTNGQIQYRIGDHEFHSLALLLGFYKIHYLDTTTLIRPAKRQKYIARCEYKAQYPDNLSFCAGDILTLLRKEEDEYWIVQDSRGKVGTVPVKLLDRYDETTISSPSTIQCRESLSPVSDTVNKSDLNIPRVLPAVARVIKKRVPCAYDTTALHLQIGDEVIVDVMHETGQWEGSVNGVHGFFPFTHIEFPDENKSQPEEN